MSEVKSVSVLIQSARGAQWAKLNRQSEARRLPAPAKVLGGGDLPGQYLPTGDEELLPGDALFEGERGRHGWNYKLTMAMPSGEALIVSSRSDNLSSFKAAAKEANMPIWLLQGAGPLAALVRIVFAYRLGLPLPARGRFAPPVVYPDKLLWLRDKEADARLIRARPGQQGN